MHVAWALSKCKKCNDGGDSTNTRLHIGGDVPADNYCNDDAARNKIYNVMPKMFVDFISCYHP